MELKALLQEMIDKKASDVFIVAGLPLTYTADGRQVRMDMAPLMPADTKELVDAIYELSGRDEQIFMDGHNHDDDFSFAVPGMGRFRVNVFRQRGSLGAVIRVIPFTLPNPPTTTSRRRHGLRRLPEGPRAGHRSCRRRQVHDACLHHRQAEQGAHGAHHHHGRPHRVRASPRGLHRHPARDSLRCRHLRRGAA